MCSVGRACSAPLSSPRSATSGPGSITPHSTTRRVVTLPTSSSADGYHLRVADAPAPAVKVRLQSLDAADPGYERRTVLARARRCAEVLLSLGGRMSAVLPIRKLCALVRTTGNRPEQAKRGAPGWNRTSDTRFRKHAEGVTGRSGLCSKVLHSPRFCADLVLARSQA